jgi:hypothetical protein
MIKRFPDHELAIERLARSSETFRSMCEDHASVLRLSGDGEHATEPKRAVSICRAARLAGGVGTEIRQTLEETAYRIWLRERRLSPCWERR